MRVDNEYKKSFNEYYESVLDVKYSRFDHIWRPNFHNDDGSFTNIN